MAERPADDEIGKILSKIQLQTLMSRFRDQKLTTISICKTLTDSQLVDLGLLTIGDRIRFRSALQAEPEGQHGHGRIMSSIEVSGTSTSTPTRQITSIFRPSRSRSVAATSTSSKKKQKKTWTGTFYCFAEKHTQKVPTATERVLLQKAGLGVKKVQFLEEDRAEIVREKLKVEFPKLEMAGGFELLRCTAQSRSLDILDCDWGARSLRACVGSQAKIYIRPIQNSLSVESVEMDSDTDGLTEPCVHCGKAILVKQLRTHSQECGGSSGDEDIVYTTFFQYQQPLMGPANEVPPSMPPSDFIVQHLDLIPSSEQQTATEHQPGDRGTHVILEESKAVEDKNSKIVDNEQVEVTDRTYYLGNEYVQPPEDVQPMISNTSLLENTSSASEKNGNEDSVTSVVQQCIAFCSLNAITEPVTVLRIYQQMLITGRALDITSETIDTGIEGSTNFILIDRAQMTKTAFEEIMEIKEEDLRKCLEVQFYGEAAADYGGPRREFFSLILRHIKDEFFEPVREWAVHYEAIGRIMALSTLQNGRLPKILSSELLEEVFSEQPESPESAKQYIMDLRKGLDSLGLIQLVAGIPSLIHLFSPSQSPQLTIKKLTHLLRPSFSEEGSNRRTLESSCYARLVKYMREAASGRRQAINLGHILKFVTGTEEEPVLGFMLEPSISFQERHSFLPTANTCVCKLTLTIPLPDHSFPSDEELFKLFDYAFSNAYFGLQ